MIYGTLGPSCRDPEILKKMFREGMNGIRLNLSHTTLEEAKDLIGAYRTAAGSLGISAGLLIDLQGPELRIGSLPEPMRMETGGRIPADGLPLPETVQKALAERPSGQEILLDDGKFLLRTEGRTSAALPSLRVLRGGVLESRKSIALPGYPIRLPALTDTDREQIRQAKKYGVTAVMQPFVRSGEDLKEVRQALEQAGCGEIRLLAKIENREGIRRIDELLPCCDEIVIARGDLGNDMDLWDLPAAQKDLAARCREAGRDFMVVTQMLDSMTHRQVPTRAEVCDIFNAVLDGASSVMLTGETASGEYPDLAIRYMAQTVRSALDWIGREYRP